MKNPMRKDHRRWLDVCRAAIVLGCLPLLLTASVCRAQKPGPEPALPRMAAIVNGAVGPFDNYCDGYGNPGARGLGYICALTLDIGMADQDLDRVLNGIVAYDRAETRGAYIGQINMLIASSFCGLNGALWGYDLARADGLATGAHTALFHVARHDRARIPVYSAEPLLDAARRLFGTRDARRFPLLPGAQVICAAKEHTAPGPVYIWCAIAIAMAEDRAVDSSLFIEDAGEVALENAEGLQAFADTLLRNIAQCVVRCGENNHARYKEIWTSCRITWIPAGQVGCALVAAPYLVLARNALPDGQPEQLLAMSITEWENKLGLTGSDK